MPAKNVLVDGSPLDMDTNKRGIGFYVNTLLNYWHRTCAIDPYVLRYKADKVSSQRNVVFPVKRIHERYLWGIDALFLPTFIKNKHFAIFHSTHPYTSLYSKKFKTIATVYDLIPLIFYEQILSKKWLNAKMSYNYYLESLKRVDHLIAISNTTQHDCIRLLGIDENKITTIPLAVDNEIYFHVKDEKRLNDIKIKYELPEKYFLYVGGLDFRKNYKRMMESYIQVSKNIPEHLVLVGSWGNDVELQQHNKIHYLNYVAVEDLVVLYTLCSGLIFPSLYEGFGLTVLEAFHCGTPVLCSNTSSLLEIAEGAALLVDPYSVSDIASGIEKLSCDGMLRCELSKKGKDRALEYTLEKMSKETLDVYNKFL
jgi:alpha-1,3-rhamnosyl/mannosyltransferase